GQSGDPRITRPRGQRAASAVVAEGRGAEMHRQDDEAEGERDQEPAEDSGGPAPTAEREHEPAEEAREQAELDDPARSREMERERKDVHDVIFPRLPGLHNPGARSGQVRQPSAGVEAESTGV